MHMELCPPPRMMSPSSQRVSYISRPSLFVICEILVVPVLSRMTRPMLPDAAVRVGEDPVREDEGVVAAARGEPRTDASVSLRRLAHSLAS
jgi:hypothetical protein